jgi:hypothetical protein
LQSWLPPLATQVPWPQLGLPSHPVGWSQVVPPDQPLLQRQVWLPPLGTQLPWPQLGLPSHPVGLLQVLPFQPVAHLQLQSSYAELRLPCDPQFRVHGGGGGGGGPPPMAPTHRACSAAHMATSQAAGCRGWRPTISAPRPGAKSDAHPSS